MQMLGADKAAHHFYSQDTTVEFSLVKFGHRRCSIVWALEINECKTARHLCARVEDQVDVCDLGGRNVRGQSETSRHYQRAAAKWGLPCHIRQKMTSASRHPCGSRAPSRTHWWRSGCHRPQEPPSPRASRPAGRRSSRQGSRRP